MKQTKDQINSMALEFVQGLEDKERLVYEIGAETEFCKDDKISFWPNDSMYADIWWSDAQLYNSQGKHIATFRRKK